MIRSIATLVIALLVAVTGSAMAQETAGKPT